jgi:hypothetical protein
MECLNSVFLQFGFSMDQLGITLCDIRLYEKEYVVQRSGLDFGDPLKLAEPDAPGRPWHFTRLPGDDTLVDRERKSKRCGINI